ncbi:MAG: PQQ-binding-like beta-propeller repeat protein [Pirellulales bacterium]|nr:PQQ-binding-like beta-propeller repeat protein [Pirellulales bacterium]
MNQNTPQPESSAIACLAASATAWVAVVFVFVVCVLLVTDYARRQWDNPFDSSEFIALKQELADPSVGVARRDAIKMKLRVLDQNLRREFFQRQRLAHVGAHLLVMGVVVLVLAERAAATLRRRMPHPGPAVSPPGTQQRLAAAGVSRIAVSVAAIAFGVIAAFAAFGVGTNLPLAVDQLADQSTAPDQQRAIAARAGDGARQTTGVAPAPEPDFPTNEEIARNWPRFRGPRADGIAAYENLPTTWDAVSGKNIAWKTPVPLPGNNSPIVWGDRIFLSGADRQRREVYCFDAGSGRLLWTREVPSTPPSRSAVPKVEAATGFAAPTMTTDGRRAYAIFANGDVVAVDLAGQIVWSRGLGVPEENMYGYAASLAIYRDRLLIQWDEGTADDKLSKMIALDAATGKTVWQVPRPVTGSWASPIVVVHDDRPALVTAADPWVIAYDPADGHELWRAEGIMGDHGVTPVAAGGLVQVGNEYGEWLAIRLGGAGNVTETHIAWRGEDGLPDTVSPLASGGLLLLTTSSGVLTCYDALSGEMLWDHDFETQITSSPTAVGRLAYVFAKNGKSFVLEPSRDECKIIAENDLGESCVTSPAVQNGRIYIRTKKHLMAIGGSEDITKNE